MVILDEIDAQAEREGNAIRNVRKMTPQTPKGWRLGHANFRTLKNADNNGFCPRGILVGKK